MPDPSVEALLAALVRTPSVNPALAPGEGAGEAAVAELARAWLEERGVRAWLEEAAPGRPNVVAETGPGGGRTLVLCGHLDTVSAGGMTIPAFGAEVRDGRLYGRGAYDMKGGVAAIMAAAAALAADPPRAGTLRLALVADEEHASLGAHAFVAAHPDGDGCIVTEPTEGQLVLAHKGFVWVEALTRGRAAHGSRWDLGVSAVGRMGPIIAGLEAHDREVLRQRTHPLLGPASLHCARVSGGTGLSTYAAECRLQVERRTLPGETPETVLAEVEEVVRRAGMEAELSVLLARPPLTCDPAAPVAAAVRRAATTVDGRAPAETGVAYWMDAAVFAAAGIPAIAYGPAGAGAHGAEEWVELASVRRCAAVLERTARDFLGGAAAGAQRMAGSRM
jgi:acetylornithine deacetylase